MAEGWVSIHRKLWDNPIAKRSGWLIVWITIISMANHEDSSFIWNGENITIKRGQWLTSLEAIKKLTKVGIQTIRSAIKYYKTNQMCIEQVTNKYRIITVLKYNEYQSPILQLTNKKQTKNKQKTTNNNNNNENKKTYIVNQETKKKMTLIEVAQIILTRYNESMGGKFKTVKPFLDNLAIWLEVYPAWEIERAIVKMPKLDWYKTLPIETLFRTRNTNGPCDYIGQILSKRVETEKNNFNDLTKQ